jgi:hypothetical protein
VQSRNYDLKVSHLQKMQAGLVRRRQSTFQRKRQQRVRKRREAGPEW